MRENSYKEKKEPGMKMTRKHRKGKSKSDLLPGPATGAQVWDLRREISVK